MRFFCIMLLVATFAFGKDIGGHSDDMWSIFPFEKSAHNAENYNIQEFYKEVSSFIDYCEYPAPTENNTTYRRECSRLQELFKETRYNEIDEKCGWGNHRIWFHWGFFNSAKDSKEINQKINRSSCKQAIKAAGIDVNKEMDLLFEKRKRHLMKQWDVVFNTPKCQSMSTKKKEAFVSLLYSIHILGDYSNIQLAELQPKFDLYKNIKNDILTIGDHSTTAKKFLNQIGLYANNSLRVPSITELLSNLSEGFTPFLYDLEKEGKNYISTFGEKYKLKPIE